MLLILSTHDLLLSFEEYLKEDYRGISYCTNKKLYERLKRKGIKIEMAYIEGGVVYTPLLEIYDGLVVVEEKNFVENLKSCNKVIDGWDKDISKFIANYKNITNQENILKSREVQ